MKPSVLFLAICATHATLVHASSVRDDIDLQTYRDFAENKGVFAVGTTNLNVNNKNGKVLGALLPDGIGVPDFSAVSAQSGMVTVIAPQLLGTVQHNPTYVLLNQDHDYFARQREAVLAGKMPASKIDIRYRGLAFGANDTHNAPQNRYIVVKRNDIEKDLNPHTSHVARYPDGIDKSKIITALDEETRTDSEHDFWNYDIKGETYDQAMPRLHKMVTEVAPAPTIADDPEIQTQGLVAFNPENYEVFAHVGAGLLEKIDPKTGEGSAFEGKRTHRATETGYNTFVHKFLTAGFVPTITEVANSKSKNHGTQDSPEGWSLYAIGKNFRFEDFYDPAKTAVTTNEPDDKKTALPLAQGCKVATVARPYLAITKPNSNGK